MGTEKVSMNSLSSRSGLGSWFSGRERSTVTWIIRRFVLQKPGSRRVGGQHFKVCFDEVGGMLGELIDNP